MSITDAIKTLNLMIEKGQDRNNEAIKVAIAVLSEKAKGDEDEVVRRIR